MTNYKHILVFRLSAMGDVAMTVPVLRALIQQYPELKITVVTRVFFKPFFRDLKNVSVFSPDLKGKHKGIFGLYRLAQELKTLDFDAIADLHNVLRTKILRLFLSRNTFVHIDKGRMEKKALISGKNFQQLKMTHQRYADVLNKIGLPIDLYNNPVFSDKVQLTEDLRKLIGQNNLPLIGIAPFAAFSSKMYPMEKMEEVIRELSKTYSIVLFGGGEKEIEQLNALENQFENTVSVAGKLSLDEELDVISNLNLMLSMDSGNGHMAAMLGVKVLTIWGVTHPFAGFAPFNQPEDYSLLADRRLYPKIPTSIYGNTYPEGYQNAAGSISPEAIVKKIKEVVVN